MEDIIKLEVIEIIISSLDLYTIERVKQLRNSMEPKISQGDLSRRLELADGFVSKVESYKQPSRYNLQHINKIINIFNLNSYNEFFPKGVIREDLIKVRIELKTSKVHDHESTKFQLVRTSRILDKTPLNEKEFELWKSKKLKYLTVLK